MILAELLEARLQLPGDVRTMLSLGCFTAMGEGNRSLWTGPGGVKHLFSTYRWISTLQRKVLILGNWWQWRMAVKWVVELSLLNFPNTLLWRTYCMEWWDKCDLVGMYIPEIFNHLLGADRSSNESNQVVNSSSYMHFCCHWTKYLT